MKFSYSWYLTFTYFIVFSSEIDNISSIDNTKNICRTKNVCNRRVSFMSPVWKLFVRAEIFQQKSYKMWNGVSFIRRTVWFEQCHISEAPFLISAEILTNVTEFFCDFWSHSGKMTGKKVKLGHDLFHTCAWPFIIHCHRTIWRCTFWITEESGNNQQL